MEEPLEVWRDDEGRGAAAQMAVDEALLRLAVRPVIRFYRWRHPAITYGYFTPFATMEPRSGAVEMIRRWTGGGVVEHGEDVTFSLAVPATAGSLREPAAERYRWIHECLARALNGCGIEAVAIATPLTSKSQGPDRCFASPVAWDVTDPTGDSKLAGGAQRQSRLGWLHQGSVRLPAPHYRVEAEWTGSFIRELAGKIAAGRTARWNRPPGFRKEVVRLVGDRYGADVWNRAR